MLKYIRDNVKGTIGYILLAIICIPFVAFGMLRYQTLVNQRGFGERPEEIITKDFILRICVLTWLLLVLILLTIFR